MFDLIVTSVGVAAGLAVVIAARQGSKAHAALSARLTRGEVSRAEAGRARLRLHLRSRNLGRVTTGVVLALLAAVLAHAAVVGGWDGRALYYVVLLSVLTVWCVAGLRQSERLVDEARRGGGP
ncbi:hypothetical protein ACFXKD_25850 [Nocardiopsis aegyptia]|uniref:hypothetical protein n=1 Tax=Nocardiopsis aegyptia TaxID=220378 RepID=UPI00366AA2BF